MIILRSRSGLAVEFADSHTGVRGSIPCRDYWALEQGLLPIASGVLRPDPTEMQGCASIAGCTHS